MGWDPDWRAQLRDWTDLGVIAVWYHGEDCAVWFEFVGGCVGEDKYVRAPGSGRRVWTTRAAEELDEEFPMGSAALKRALDGGRAIRADYVLTGIRHLPQGDDYPRARLHGTECGRVTHVVSRLYLGGFRLASGEPRSLEAAPLFPAEPGRGGPGNVREEDTGGEAAACAQAMQTRQEVARCSVPLRVRFAPVRPELVFCPGGARRVGDHCEPAAVGPPSARPDAGAAPPSGSKTLRGARMVSIPAGSFWMGSDQTKHQVSVAAFSMDETEVTLAQYRDCVNAHICHLPQTASPGCNWGKSGRDQHPMNCVSWVEAQTFCEQWAGKRLPTEEEWEYAARGTTGREFPWGAEPPGSARLCWQQSGTCRVATHPQGASPFGLHDMAGNVGEWTASFHCPYLDSHCNELRRVYRGGGWRSSDLEVRARDRAWDSPSNAHDDLGFRCAR